MIEWGTVGEWVGGVGAIIGAGVPLVLYLVERRERIAAQAEARALREQEAVRTRQAQARRISYRFGYRKPETSDRFVTRGAMLAILSNASETPVRAAALVYETLDGTRLAARWGLSGPGDHDEAIRARPADDVLAVLVFEDDNGVWWRRGSDGKLEEAQPVDFGGFIRLGEDEVEHVGAEA